MNPVVLSDARILAAYLIFLGSYCVFALGKFPGLKIDRPGAAIIGANVVEPASSSLSWIRFGSVRVCATQSKNAGITASM